MTQQSPDDGWAEWSRHVLIVLEDIPALRQEIAKLREEYVADRLAQRTELVKLQSDMKHQAGLWSAIVAAAISAIGLVVAQLLR